MRLKLHHSFHTQHTTSRINNTRWLPDKRHIKEAEHQRNGAKCP
jgi:hypothetical protein